MAFKLAKERIVRRDVTVKVPVDGGFKDETMEAWFRIIQASELKQIEADQDYTLGLLDRAVTKLAGLVDDDGKALDFSDAVKAQVLDLPFARAALMRAYLDAAQGGRAGN